MKSKRRIPLSTFSELKTLRSLSIQKCNRDSDVTDLKSTSTKLKKVLIIGLKKKTGRRAEWGKRRASAAPSV